MEGTARDTARRVRVAFPISSATGTAASASVYFELEPGAHVGIHTDSSEEFLVVIEGSGEALLGDEVTRVEAGQVVVVPAMVRHDITNVGDRDMIVLLWASEVFDPNRPDTIAAKVLT